MKKKKKRRSTQDMAFHLIITARLTYTILQKHTAEHPTAEDAVHRFYMLVRTQHAYAHTCCLTPRAAAAS